MKKPKLPIFIISGKSPISASGGGYSTYAYNLARIIKKLKHPLFLLSLGETNKETKTNVGTIITHSIKVPFLNVNIYALPGLPIYSLFFAKTIFKKLKSENYKKVIVWGIGPWGLAGAFLKILFPKKVIFIDNYFTTTRHEWKGSLKALKIRDYGLLPKLKYLFIYLTAVQVLSLFERLVLKLADKIVTNYKSTENIIHKEFGISRKRFYRTRFYVQVYRRKSIQVTNDSIAIPKKYIFYISRHDPRKGINHLLNSYRMLRNMGYKIPLLIGGRGDMLEQNKKLAKRLKLFPYVKFLGFINDPKILIKKSTIFAFTSIEEGAGALTINEAMEMGASIVTFACDGIVEDITSEKDGLLIPMEDDQEMALGFKRLLENPNFAKKLSLNARRKYNQSFNFKNMYLDIKKLLSLY